jgi:hypothetical protein
MRAIAVVAAAGCVLFSCARPLAAAEPTVACGLLTPAQIGAATSATIGAGRGIVVKKGGSVFEIRVYGFELSQAKTVSKTLAQNASSKF